MKFTAILATIAGVSAVSRESYEARFADHVATYNLQFQGVEWVERLKIFIEHDVKIEAHNAANKSYKMGHNQFSHLTVEEWKDIYTGLRRPNLRMPGAVRKTAADLKIKALPESVDWRTAGAVTGVKDQGQCGSCWSFSTTGGLEGAYAIKTGSLLSFSEQMLVDCDTTLNKGCNGGMMDRADRWIRSNGGLCTEADYPYYSGTTETAGTCQTTCKPVAASTVTSWTDLDDSNDALMTALAQQPVSVAVDAEADAFMHYQSGIVTAPCGTTLDHGVLAVGYGTGTDGTPYWIVKNSWGTSWGEAGYIYLERKDQKGGMCGITSAASFVSV